MGEEKFLKAGTAEHAPVRPIKGLGQDEVLETIHGELFPENQAERDAEVAAMGEEEIVVDIEEVQEVAEVVARRAPREPTEEERMRHEATHLPYRSWCVHCVRGRG